MVITDDFWCRNMVVTDDFWCRNMVVPDDFWCRNMVVPDDFCCSNMVVRDDFRGSNMVVTYDILTTQWSCFGRKSSLSFSESSQRRKIQSRKSLKSSLRRIIIAKISYFFRVACLADQEQQRQHPRLRCMPTKSSATMLHVRTILASFRCVHRLLP